MAGLSKVAVAAASSAALVYSAANAFSTAPALRTQEATAVGVSSERSFLSRASDAPTNTNSTAAAALSVAGGLAVAGSVAAATSRRKNGKASRSSCSFVPVASAQSFGTFREALVACHALGDNEDVAPVSEMDAAIEGLEQIAKQVTAGVAAAVVFAGSMAQPAEAYPIFAQQNYKEPIEANGKIACANCHLRGKPIEVRMPHEVLPDTIFKIVMEVPANYEKKQPGADGEMAPMNVGGIIIMPEGWKLAPKDRLPKPLKKEMKGLAWSAWSKEKPNVLVAGPIPNSYAPKMVAPVLAPTPGKEINFGKFAFNFGGNRGRGQVYPEGNSSNINAFSAPATGTITAIEGDATKKVTVTKEDGSTATVDVLPGATFVSKVGDKVTKDEPITTDPNVGGFGQEEKEVQLQDLNRVYGYLAVAISLYVAQLAFVLKKKQFEKVQLAEGF
mmetsp:Transcript_41113/g.96542  ORF Transcript_41113/g.96542 Transcript_41113/m.96542 type:complete len:445 (+) Transcript_41113:86-1420(+)